MGRPVTQWQILSKNPDKHAEFYTRLFGWKIDANNPLNYRRVDTGSKRGIPGGFWPASPEGHNFVQLFVEVEDVAADVHKAAALGGKIIIPPQKLPDGDEMAVLLDSEGMAFVIWKPGRADG